MSQESLFHLLLFPFSIKKRRKQNVSPFNYLHGACFTNPFSKWFTKSHHFRKKYKEKCFVCKQTHTHHLQCPNVPSRSPGYVVKAHFFLDGENKPPPPPSPPPSPTQTKPWRSPPFFVNDHFCQGLKGSRPRRHLFLTAKSSSPPLLVTFNQFFNNLFQ